MPTETENRGRDAQGKHTPGPWRFSPVYESETGRLLAVHLVTEWADVPHSDPNILSVRDDWIWYLLNTPKGQANARLIAASPDLLAACRVAEQVIEYLRARLRGDDVERLDVEYHAPKIRAAIRKAEGGAQ